jgi:GTP diphosphokinase / guanosine-3',5'-bis(diphosphate) 3'-diphosphatase
MDLDRALEIAHGAHHDQVDKQGEPYINHVLRVAALVKAMSGDEDTQILALLHDVPEDTELSIQELHELGLREDLCLDLDALTKRTRESKVDAARRAVQRPRAKLAKIADNMDNTNPLRVLALYQTDPATAIRLAQQYDEVRDILTGAVE